MRSQVMAMPAPTLISDGLRHYKDFGAPQPRQQIRHQIIDAPEPHQSQAEQFQSIHLTPQL